MRLFVLFAATALPYLPAAGADLQSVHCSDERIKVSADDAETQKYVCQLAATMLDRLATCNVVTQRPITIELKPAFEMGCLGLYHCGEDRIELLNPEPFESAREAESAFAMLNTRDYYASVIAHELAHAAYDNVPCPFGDCRATDEYVAYTMQVYTLESVARASFEAAIPYKRRVVRDEINPMIVLMAPDIFARKAWMHFSQQDDGCAFIQQIMNGDVLLDYEHP